jgi:hypothetical protein
MDKQKVVYIDNGKAFDAKIFSKNFKVVKACPYNPKAKLVERFFRKMGKETK